MKKIKIVADDKIPFLHGVLESCAEVVYLSGKKTSAADVKDADAIFTRTRTLCNEALLKGSNVKLICTATIGYDHIDTDYCEKAGIRWVNAPGCNSSSVQQYITAAILTLIEKKNLKLKNLTLGIIGVGNVGSKVATAAKSLGINVLLNDPPRAEKEGDEAFVSLEKLLAESDIVTCHTPLTKEGRFATYHLASDEFFDKMKQDSIFINSSRGPVVDSQALKRAAQQKLSAFILDVWEGEPDIDSTLLQDSFIATPHIAGYSTDGKANGTSACVQEFARFFGVDEFKEWVPTQIPMPPMDTTIWLDGEGKSDEQIFFEAVTHTYPIWNDSNRLKNSPEEFESLRGNYWIRREFANFNIEAKNIDEETLKRLRGLGFSA